MILFRLYRLHFGDYGGYALKIVSFVLGLISCFVIISGVMIWLVARDRKNVSEKQKRFNERVVRIYLAICLSMYPVTAASFIAVKIFNPAGQSFIYQFYFIAWLLLTVFFVLKKENHFTNKYALLLGGVLGLCIPIVNGFSTGNWIWETYTNQQYSILIIDVFWMIMASITLFAVAKLNKPVFKPVVPKPQLYNGSIRHEFKQKAPSEQ